MKKVTEEMKFIKALEKRVTSLNKIMDKFAKKFEKLTTKKVAKKRVSKKQASE